MATTVPTILCKLEGEKTNTPFERKYVLNDTVLFVSRNWIGCEFCGEKLFAEHLKVDNAYEARNRASKKLKSSLLLEIARMDKRIKAAQITLAEIDVLEKKDLGAATEEEW
jgi:hypothetical protein